MAALRLWATLPEDMFFHVSGFLRCRADRVRMAGVNRYWRATVSRLRLPPQLPWLIFPSAAPPTFYSACAGDFRNCRLPADVRAARWRGSFDGSWVVLALAAPHAYTLYNLNSGARIALPPVFRSDDNAESPLDVLAATLSASPSNGGAYVVAAIALVDDQPTAAFWTPGRHSWFSTGGPLAEMPQDVNHYAGAFYFVTPREELLVFRLRAARGPNGGVTLHREDLDMRQREDYEFDVESIHEFGRMKRYLVESGTDLLMAVRDVYFERGTRDFWVFRLSAIPTFNGYQPRYTWEQIFELNGRMLFLGPGCSRSFEVARYDGFQDQDSRIYFLDESFDSMPFEARQFNLADIGRYSISMGQQTSESWPPRPWPGGLEDARPTWWLH